MLGDKSETKSPVIKLIHQRALGLSLYPMASVPFDPRSGTTLLSAYAIRKDVHRLLEGVC